MNIQDHINKVTTAIKNLKEYAISGDIKAYNALAEIKENKIEDYLKSNIHVVEDIALEELRNGVLEYNQKSYKEGGIQYTVRSGSTRYYYTEIEEVKQKKQEYENSTEFKDFKDTQDKYKLAYKMKQQGQVMVDEETGEIIDPSNINIVHARDGLTIKRLG